jgi:hypothetical protein
MSMSESLSALSDLPGFRELDALNLRELRVELAEARRFRSMMDSRVGRPWWDDPA